jgi:imidazolonepropionase-like amidohydrolase
MASPKDLICNTSTTAQKVAIKNVRVFHGEQLTAPTSVVIEGGIIVSDGTGAQEIDGANGVLIPGLIDSHVHLEDERHLQRMADWGVTTALGMGEWRPEKLHALRNREGLTDIRSACIPATTPGSLHSKLLPIPRVAFVSGPGDASRYVRDRLAEGADYIKVIADLPGPDQPTLNALVSAAHEQGKLVITHAATYIPFTMALAAKPDVITHVPRDKVLDDESVARMMTDELVSVPTLTMMETLCKPLGWSAIMRLLLQPSLLWTVIKSRRWFIGAESYEHCKESVMRLYRAGVPVLVGTDSNEEEDSPFQIRHGEALHHELELLVDAGMSTVNALRAATSVPAKKFGLSDRGVIEPGKRADLVLLRDDPINDIRATRSIQRVWCGGIEHTRD